MPGYTQQVNGAWWSDIVEVNGENQNTITDISGNDPFLCRDLVEYTIAPQAGCLYVFDFSETVIDNGNVTFCPCFIPYDNNTNQPIQSGNLTLAEFLDNNTVIRPIIRSLLAVNYKVNTNLTNGLGDTERTVANGNITGLTPTGLRTPTGTTLTDATIDVARSTEFADVPPQFIIGQLFNATTTTYSGPTIAGFSTSSTFTFDGVTYQSVRKSALYFTVNNQRCIVANQPLHSSYENNFILEGGPEGTADGTTNSRTISGTEPFRTDLSQFCSGDQTLWGYKQNTTSTIRMVFVNTATTGVRNFGNYGGNRGWRIRLNNNRLEVIYYEQNGTTNSNANTKTWIVSSNIFTNANWAGSASNQQWNMIHLTIDDSVPTTLEIFLNGTSLGTRTVTSNTIWGAWRGTNNRATNPYTTQWGNYFSNEGWRGYFAELSEYDHAFSASEIATDFTNFKGKYWEAQ